MGGPTRHCLPSFSQRVVGWYFWCEWCYLFLHPGRLVIKAHANPNLGQNLKLEIQGPSQVSTLFTNRLSLLVPTHSYSSQEPACLGRPNFPASSRENSSVFPWPHLAGFLPAHSTVGQVAFKLHIPSSLPGTCPPPIGPEVFSPLLPMQWLKMWLGPVVGPRVSLWGKSQSEVTRS